MASLNMYFANLTMEVPYLHKPNIFSRVFWLARSRVWGELKMAKDLRNSFGKLHEADVLAQASS